MLYAILAFVITALDQLTKKSIRDHVRPGEKIETAGGRAYITNLKNSGAAYGLFSQNPKLLHSLTAASTLMIIHTYLNIFKSEKSNASYKLSFAMLMGGAAGNIIDRVKRKYVTDFICVPFSEKAPVFNIADFFVALGALVFMLAGLFEKKTVC